MKVGLIADLHLAYYPPFLSSILDMHTEREYLNEVFRVFADEGVELIAVLGDLLHTWRGRSGVMALMNFLNLIRHYSIPTFMVRGNHDALIPRLYEELADNTGGLFITFVGQQSVFQKRPILVSEEEHKGKAYDKVMQLHSIRPVAVLPHASSVLPPGVLSEMYDNTLTFFDEEKNGSVLFAHYFLESRAGSLASSISAREFIVPDVALTKKGVTIFAGHDHRSFAGKGSYVVGSLLPRDARLGGSGISYGIARITPKEVSYTPYHKDLPYALVYSKTHESVDDAVEWIKQVLQEKELLSITKLVIKEPDVSLASFYRHMVAGGVDARRVLIRRLVPAVYKETDGDIVELQDVATLKMSDAFHQYMETHKGDFTLPDGITHEHIVKAMEAVLATLQRGEEND